MVGGLLDQSLDVHAPHQLGDHVGLTLVLAQVEDGHDVGVGAQPSHGLGLAGDARPGGLIQTLGVDQRKGDLAVEEGVVGQVDLLLAALAQEFLNRVNGPRRRRRVGRRQDGGDIEADSGTPRAPCPAERDRTRSAAAIND